MSYSSILSTADNAHLHLQGEDTTAPVQCFDFWPKWGNLKCRVWNKTDRANVYSICSVWFKDWKLFRIWGLGLANVLNSRDGWSSPLIDSWEGRESGGRAALMKLSCVVVGSPVVVSGRRQLSKACEAKQKILGIFSPASPSGGLGNSSSCPCLLGSLALGCSLASSRQHRTPYLWGAAKTGERADPPQVPLLSATSDPQANALQSQRRLFLTLPHWPGLVFAVQSEWLWSLLTAKFRNIKGKKKKAQEKWAGNSPKCPTIRE